MSFLYQGADPAQSGVAAGTIVPQRAAAIVGTVVAEDGPLENVAVSILDHPEYGTSRTDAEGRFAIAVNGGGRLTVALTRQGYLVAHRQVDVPWNDYAQVDDVELVAIAAEVTRVELGVSDTFQVARGRVAVDDDGERRATLLFAPGTTAEMVMPDGTRQPLTAIDVRATEYTVGDAGPQRMPGPLPPETAYTYAVEFSVDEAITAGAARVDFSSPVINYVEDIVGFPVGSPVPTGYYDRELGAWIASDDGIVVQVATVADGGARLDTDGDGVADDADRLVALGITDAELAALGSLYGPGQRLWRVPIPHFTPWDHNWPLWMADSAIAPDVEDPDPLNASDKDCQRSGSIIDCESQVLGQGIAIPGTPLRLHYRSDRVPGRVTLIDVPVSGDTLPPGVLGMQAELEIAGRVLTERFAPSPNVIHRFVWDGTDRFGRLVQGRQPFRVTVIYEYEGYYGTPPEGGRSFGLRSGAADRTGLPTVRRPVPLATTFDGAIELRAGRFDASPLGLGGWTLDVHHTYDRASRQLHLGSGQQRSAETVTVGARIAAGTGERGHGGDGGAAEAAQLARPDGVVVAPDGTTYVADAAAHVVRGIDVDGTISTVAGTGEASFGGDGGPAVEAMLDTPRGLAMDASGALLIADSGNRRIRRVADGAITTIAGNGAEPPCTPSDMDLQIDPQPDPLDLGDGGPATEARLYEPVDVAVGPDGTIYIADVGEVQVRRVRPGGVIDTLVAAPLSKRRDPCVMLPVAVGQPPDFELAAAATSEDPISLPYGLDVGDDGTLYIADRGTGQILQMPPGGRPVAVAGSGQWGPIGTGDGGPAVDAVLRGPTDVHVGAGGSLLIVEQSGRRLRLVTADGTIRTLAGERSATGVAGGEIAAARLALRAPTSVDIAPDGTVYLTDAGLAQVLRLGRADRISYGDDDLVPSEDGAVVYRFDRSGRHLATLDGLTGATLLRFEYSEGLLVAITDVDENVTRIERGDAGLATTIIGPFGHRNELRYDDAGWLAEVVRPDGTVWRMTATPEGLLTSLMYPRGATSTYGYDDSGRLVDARDAAGGRTTLERTELPDGHRVVATSAEGRTWTFEVEAPPSGELIRRMTDSAGFVTTARTDADGTVALSSHDGSELTVEQIADPRWGLAVPFPSAAVARTPTGQTIETFARPKVTQIDGTDPFSVVRFEQQVTVDGRETVQVIDVTARTITRTSPEGRTTTAAFDERGRIVAEQVGSLAAASRTFDDRGRMASMTRTAGSETRTSTFVYGADGLLAQVNDPLGRSTMLARDTLGRIVSTVRPDGRVIGLGYDDNGNLTSLTPPGRPSHGFTFTEVDLRRTYTPPGAEGASTATTYDYNLDQQPTRVTRPDGRVVEIAYDGAGRIGAVGEAGRKVAYTYDAQGRVAAVTTAAGDSIGYEYADGLVSAMTTTGTVASRVELTHDDELRLEARKLLGGRRIDITYDQDDLPLTVGAAAMSWRPDDGLLDAIAVDGVETALDYDGFGQVSAERTTRGGTVLLERRYVRDLLGRIVEVAETGPDGSASTASYAYDEVGRLIAVTRDGPYVTTFVYDDNGNRVGLRRGGAVEDATFDDQDRLLQQGATSYVWAADGQLQSMTGPEGTTLYDYGVDGALRSVTLPDGRQVRYVIDGKGRRLAKYVDDVFVAGWVYEGATPIAQVDADGQVVSEYITGVGRTPDYLRRDGRTYRIVPDQLDSVRLVVDTATGEIAQELRYDADGRVVSDSNPGFQPFGFAGGHYDPDTELVRFGARDYDPASARWTAKDPTDFGGGDPNLYAYAGGDPINRVDPSGLDWLDTVGDFAAGFGDTVSLGLTRKVRRGMGVDGVVDYCSSAYTAGGWTSTAVEVLLAGKGLISGGRRLLGARTAARAPAGPVRNFGPGAAHADDPAFRSLYGLPKNAQLSSSFDDVADNLARNHGVNRHLASERLHDIKRSSGLGGADNVIFDRTGGVWDPRTGDYLGSLTQGGGG